MPYLQNIELKPRYTIQENSYNDINFEKRTNMFKGTIIICVVYGLFAFLLMSFTAFSPSARVVVFDNFLPFTLVFIIGTILIICLMLYYIFSYIPVNVTYRLDGVTCPDYWDVEILDDNYVKNSFDPQYPSSYFKYKCVMNKDIFDTKTMFIDSSNLISDKTKAYKYTNILDDIKPFGASYDGYAGSWDVSSNIQLNESLNKHKDYVKLYKDINKYGTSNIRSFLNSTSDTLSKATLNNLKNIALVQNNYKVINPSSSERDNITDMITYSNMWNSTSTSVSPITWNYSSTSSNSVGIGTTTTLEISGTTSDINAIILDWKDLKADKAFYNGYDIETSNSEEEKKSVKKGLNIYFNPSASDKAYLNLLGRVEITSNPSNNPTISMKFIPDVRGKFNRVDNITNQSNDYILNSENIIISKDNVTNDKLQIQTAAGASNNYIKLLSNEVSSKMTIINKPVIQLYDKTKTRPTTISKDVLSNGTSPIPLNCDELYPAFLESMDDDHNNLRCAYSKVCNIPWSDLRCPLQNKSQTHSY
jgi:hypothetical protein